MIRATFLLMLAAAQAIGSLAGGLTLCLHHDGSYCLETQVAGCCHRRAEAATSRSCCGTKDAQTFPIQSVCEFPSDCTHVPLASGEVVFSQCRASEVWTTPLNSSGAAFAWTPHHPAAPAAVAHDSFDLAAAGPRGALAFLAPIMLRC